MKTSFFKNYFQILVTWYKNEIKINWIIIYSWMQFLLQIKFFLQMSIIIYIFYNFIAWSTEEKL